LIVWVDGWITIVCQEKDPQVSYELYDIGKDHYCDLWSSSVLPTVEFHIIIIQLKTWQFEDFAHDGETLLLVRLFLLNPVLIRTILSVLEIVIVRSTTWL